MKKEDLVKNDTTYKGLTRDPKKMQLEQDILKATKKENEPLQKIINKISKAGKSLKKSAVKTFKTIKNSNGRGL
ncbi:MAG: hypothetical protein K0Q51_597 [Rickettsiaceae bacterium]|jgi:hypothetical protein|nr:hypothetical protein [Rickettsiaceae bacterium]